jgi:SAM-dependent methyltransferase
VLDPPLPPNSFDVIYSGGVLHHTPDARLALERLMSLLRPGGLAYVWLYWKVPGALYSVKSAIRRLLNPLPYRVRRLPTTPFAIQAALRNRSLTFSEHWIIQHDFFTPRWRSEHTPEEISLWFTALGMTSQLRSTSRDGFGTLAMR